MHEDWKIFEKFQNVKVIYKYDIVPWIISSKGLIHRGCSTAIDAYFLKNSILLKTKKKITKFRKKFNL